MAGKLCWALGLVLLFAAAVLTQAPLAVGLLGFFLLLTLLLVLEVRYLRGKVEAELIVPDQPAVQGRPFVLTVRLTNHSPLPIPQLLTLVQAADEWGGNTITLRCSGMLGSKARAEQRLTLQANKSGVWQLRLQSVTLWDHLGLFKAQCGLPQTAQSLCVLPQSARLGSDTQPDPDADGMQESDRSVLGGNYDVREYREGDSLKQVHWKLRSATHTGRPARSAGQGYGYVSYFNKPPWGYSKLKVNIGIISHFGPGYKRTEKEIR